MDKLKNFIENNKQEFEDIELPVGHMERFKDKLEAQKKKTVRRRLVWGVVAAACLGILFTIQTQYSKDHMDNLCELSTEISEVRMYYNMQMSATIAQMEELYKENQTPGRLELLQQTQEVIAVNNDFENRILPTLPCSEEALFAMNQHYDASLSGMNILLQQMRKAGDMEDLNN